ncbi:glucosamine-6-phosphate deaminase [Alicyclobacillus acidoterrestris]|uniref:glucosamine-6-phosphate deaminase n=1 Tax=Alicyclobacillus suci TaxID=2816080 RepID=UPI0011930A9F|nr:glucosamine-6-phosphate deaminase [Alicyclobacillus suci]GEO25944.1 glucosamine-6-phosphate deaminase [Alicyclobacillus acidoterrestris]
MNIRVFRTPSDAGIYAASILERVVTSKERPVLGLATGGTVIPVYEAFVNLVRCGLDVSHVTTLNLDEYIGLAPDHPQSYHAFMNEHLFSKVGIPVESTHLPNGIASDLRAECERYNAVIRKNPIDIQILGIGVNGHIGFNEPSHTLITGTHVVNLSAETIKMNARFFQNEEEVPRQAITMGVQSILQAKQIILLAFGAQKAEIIREALNDGIRTDVPASILQLHKDVTVILDEQSARHLDL